MPKAKTIDRVEFTKNRRIIYSSSVADKEQEVIAHSEDESETCPLCGAKLFHESGCMRCTCGWSRC